MKFEDRSFELINASFLKMLEIITFKSFKLKVKNAFIVSFILGWFFFIFEMNSSAFQKFIISNKKVILMFSFSQFKFIDICLFS
jgi:hypothetical protein